MEAGRFDRVVRLFARREASRRQVVSAILASAGAGVLTALSGGRTAAERDLVHCCLYVCEGEVDPDRQVRNRCIKPNRQCPATFDGCTNFLRCPNLQTCDSCRLGGCN